jgi:hypothetical protein
VEVQDRHVVVLRDVVQQLLVVLDLPLSHPDFYINTQTIATQKTQQNCPSAAEGRAVLFLDLESDPAIVVPGACPLGLAERLQE